MQTVNFKCDIIVNKPSHPLDFKILLDDEPIFETITNKPLYEFSYDITETDDDEDVEFNTHSIKFVMSGKTDDHTSVDSKGNLDTAQVEIRNIKFDEIELADLFMSNDNLARYTHNQNGYGDETTEVFDFCMGCNGTAEFKFTTPVYIWLLENMM